ncbi:MAG: hypothetical protein MUP64_11910 [Anaerolineae bacterium]|nr:hypothetical protein [Anaerolineae bacterium]
MSSPGIELAARRAVDAEGRMSMEVDLLIESSIGRGAGSRSSCTRQWHGDGRQTSYGRGRRF